RNNSGSTARPLSCLLATHFSDECRSHRERALSDRERKRRQTPGCRPKDNLRTFSGIEFGVVTRTFKNALVAFCCLHPLRDWTRGVSANQRIGDDAVGRSRSRLVVEFTRIKFYEDDLVESRAPADH